MAAYSIVVVTRDAPRLLLGCLAAIGAVARPDELLVVDNGSTADLAGVLRLARVPPRLLRLAEHGSLGRAYNAGLDAASAPYVLLLHADVLLERDPASAVELLAGDATIAVAGAPLREGDRDDVEAGWQVDADPVRPRRLRQPLATLAGRVVEVDAVSSAGMLVRRDAPRFDERYWFRFEDLDACLRQRERGQRVVVTGDLPARHLVCGGARERRADPAWATREIASRLLFHERWCAGGADAADHEPARDVMAARDLAARLEGVRGTPIPRDPVLLGATG